MKWGRFLFLRCNKIKVFEHTYFEHYNTHKNYICNKRRCYSCSNFNVNTVIKNIQQKNDYEDITAFHSLLNEIAKIKYTNWVEQRTLKENYKIYKRNDYYSLLQKWNECIHVYINWAPKIDEDKYTSKCFSVPSFLTFHVVVKEKHFTNGISWDQFVEKYEKYNVDHYWYEQKKREIKNEERDKKEGNVEKEEIQIQYSVRKKNIDKTNELNYIEQINELEVTLIDQNKKEEEEEEHENTKNASENEKKKVFFFLCHTNELMEKEDLRKWMSKCLLSQFNEKENEKEFLPFLYIVYDLKSLIHILNNIKVDVVKIKNVFDMYIIASLLQWVPRGDKLQNVYESYFNKPNCTTTIKNNFNHWNHSKENKNLGWDVTSINELHSTETENKSSEFPCEFSDVLLGKFGIFGWGKYQKEKIKKTKKQKKNKKEKKKQQIKEEETQDIMIQTVPLIFFPTKVQKGNDVKKLIFGNKRSLHEITEEDMVAFCISRSNCMMNLFPLMMKEFEKNINLLNIYVKIEQPLTLCISLIEKRGIYLNEDKIKEIQKNTLDPTIFKEEIQKLCNSDINLNSSKQVASLIYKHLIDYACNHSTKQKKENLKNGELLHEKNHTVNQTKETNESEEEKEEEGLKTDSTIYSSLEDNLGDENKSFLFSNTINEMKRNNNLQTNNKILKIILDEIEKSESSSMEQKKEEREKIKKIINNVKLYRESKKLFQNYIENLPKFIHKETKKIHCNFNQIGASTGRMSCEQPNLQNIHSKFKCAFTLKQDHSLINSVPLNGIHENENKKKLIAFDYKQMELFVMAYLSFDKNLLKMLCHNDVFVETAKLLFNTEHVTNELRRATKTIIYGILYGQTENGLAKNLLTSETDALKLIQSFFSLFPNVYKFMQMQKHIVKHINCVYTLIGRKRIIPPTLKNKYRVSMNTPIQGCAADIMKFSLLSCFSVLTPIDTNGFSPDPQLLHITKEATSILNEFPNSTFLRKHTNIILQVHDELLLENQNLDTDVIVKVLKPIFENAFYNMICYTNSKDRLRLLYGYMENEISLKEYLEQLGKVNNDSTLLEQPNETNLNTSNGLFNFFNFKRKSKEFNLTNTGIFHNITKNTMNNNYVNNFDHIFTLENFKLPVKVQLGDNYKEFS